MVEFLRVLDKDEVYVRCIKLNVLHHHQHELLNFFLVLKLKKNNFKYNNKNLHKPKSSRLKTESPILIECSSINSGTGKLFRLQTSKRIFRGRTLSRH